MMSDLRSVQSDALSFDVATVAYKGARESQEDQLVSNFPLGQETGFAVLADGMGGHASGAIASALVMSEVFTQLKMQEGQLDDGLLNIPETLRAVTDAANQRIADHIKTDDETHGMGSTLLTTVIRQNKLYWISVGDSPLLLFRDGALRQLNKDHSMAPQIDMMIKVGAMTEEAGRNHPDRNTLTSAMSGGVIDAIDCPSRPVALQPDDIVIAASDGLQFLSSATIAKTLKQTQSGHCFEIAKALLTALQDLDNPDQDNAAIVVIKLNSGDQNASALDADELPVLATADDESEGNPLEETGPVAAKLMRVVQLKRNADHPPAQTEVADAEDAPDEKAAYWYRGQKYYKD